MPVHSTVARDKLELIQSTSHSIFYSEISGCNSSAVSRHNNTNFAYGQQLVI